MNKAGEVKDMLNPRIRKFNPGTLQSDGEIKAQFVVRNHELGIVLDVLRGNIQALSCQHVLVVAPRGRGKTMLLTRAAAEIRTDDQLSKRLLPVQFMEESQEIFNLADFWLDTLFHLGRESARSNPQLARELQDTHAALSVRWHERALEEHARAAVLDAADRLDKKLVLMVENLQALSKNVDQDFGWKLRGVLQSEPQIMLLASATSRFKGLDDAEQPFFELFRIVDLEPLGTDECRQLWQVASGDKVSGRNIRPLEILTGGSPRLLVIVAGFARHLSLRQLMEELVTLIDEHTEYFRGHLEVFGRTERRVYVAVIDLWQLSKPGEIAARARINTRVVSTMLGRLVSRGAVTMEGSGKKRLYRATEPLYSIYYKLRRERNEAAIVENLIRFMAVFYNEAERLEMFDRLRREAAESSAIREGLDNAVAALPHLASEYPGNMRSVVEGPRPGDYSISAHSESAPASVSVGASKRSKEWSQRLSQEIEMAFGEGALKKVIEIVDQALPAHGSDSYRGSESFAAWALHKKADAHEQLGHSEAAIAVYDEVIERFATARNPDLRSYVAAALFDKGNLRRSLAEFAAATTAYDEVVQNFGSSDRPGIQWRVAAALLNKGDVQVALGDTEAAIACYDAVITRFGASTEPYISWWVAFALINKGDAQGKLNDMKAAIATYDELVGRFGESDEPRLQSCVAHALKYKADALRELGDFEEATMMYDKVVERFRASDDPDLHWWVAAALVNKGNTIGRLGDLEAAIAAYDCVVELFGASSESSIHWWVAVALDCSGIERAELGDFKGAIAAYDEVIARCGGSGGSRLQLCLARSILHKGHAQRHLGDLELAIATYDEVINQFEASDPPELRIFVARAMLHKGDVQEKLRRFAAAIAVYKQLVECYGNNDVLELQGLVAKALFNAGYARRECGDVKAAIVAFSDIGNRFGTSEAKELQVWVAIGLVFEGLSRAELGSLEAAITIYDEVVGRFSHSDKQLRMWVATALLNKGRVRVQLGEISAAITAYEGAVTLFDPNEAPDLQIPIAAALLDLARAYEESGDFERVTAAYDELIEQFGTNSDPNLSWRVAAALLERGDVQQKCGDIQGAIAVYDKIVEQFGDSTGVDLQWRVAAALINRGSARAQLGDVDVEIAAYDEVVERFGDNDAPQLQNWVIVALVIKGMWQNEAGRAEDTLRTCEILEGRINALAHEDKNKFGWRANLLRVKALLIQQKHSKAMETFRSAYDLFIPGIDTMMDDILQIVPDLIAAKASAHEVAEILASDTGKSNKLIPLIVALRQHAGEEVRAPVEVLEVAADIRERIREKVAERTPAGS